MSTYKRPPVKKKRRKKYQLQNPTRFLGFLIVLAILVILIVLLARACMKPSSDNQGTGAVLQENSGASQGTTISGAMGEIERQTVAWIAGLVNMTQGIKTQEEEPEPVAKIYTVIIDPGCGGTDSGNPGTGNTMEKTINLQVGLKLQAALEAKYPQVQVVMTRSDDSTLDTARRVSIVNASGGDLAISLHCDYFAGSSQRRGVTTYYRQPEGEEGTTSQEESGAQKTPSLSKMSQQIAQTLQSLAAEALQTEDRGIVSESYDILTETTVPTVLMEMAYLTDAEDYNKITDDSYQESLAAALADGIYQELQSLYPDRQKEAAGQTGNESSVNDSSAQEQSAPEDSSENSR